jgi:cytochrome c553
MMKKGEKWFLIGSGIFVVAFMSIKTFMINQEKEADPGIPFYTTSSPEYAKKASILYRKYNCRDCHSLWGIRNIMQAVPAPSLDGMGEFRDEKWLYAYLSAENPQAIIPSRLKRRYQMPSFSSIPEEDRVMLAKYIASLKVEDWYLEEARKSRYEKLTGKDYVK